MSKVKLKVGDIFTFTKVGYTEAGFEIGDYKLVK